MFSTNPQKRKISASENDNLTFLSKCTAPKVIKYCFGKPESLNKRTPHEKLFDLKDVRFVNERYLTSYDKYVGNSSGSTCIVIKSEMGTGKTSRFLDYARDKGRILIIGSRKTYCDFMCSQNSDLTNYQDIKGKIDFISHPKTICQVQSLRRIKEIEHGTIFAQWDVIYLDEFDSICKELNSDLSSNSEKSKNVSYLSKLVATIRHVIVSDANIGQWHYEFLHMLMRGIRKDNMCLVINMNKGLFEDDGCRQIYVYNICTLSPDFYKSTFIGSLKDYCKTDLNKQMKPDTLDYLIRLEEKLITGRTAVTNTESVYMQILLTWYKTQDSSDPYLGDFILRDISSKMVSDVVELGESIVVICSSRTHAEFI